MKQPMQLTTKAGKPIQFSMTLNVHDYAVITAEMRERGDIDENEYPNRQQVNEWLATEAQYGIDNAQAEHGTDDQRYYIQVKTRAVQQHEHPVIPIPASSR